MPSHLVIIDPGLVVVVGILGIVVGILIGGLLVERLTKDK